MKLGAIVAAAVVAVGVGQAGAATVTTERYDLKLRYNGTAYDSVDYADMLSDDSGEDIDFAEGTAPSWIKRTVFSDLNIGDIVNFSAVVNYLDPPEYDTDFGNGGTAPECSIGSQGCPTINMTDKFGDTVILAYSDRIDITFSTTPGSLFQYQIWTQDRTYISDDDRYWYWVRFERANFTVVDQPAPVPLPATAALLPLGIGALAMMRKRRKSQGLV